VETGQKKSILFVSMHNSVRSQMSEGLLREFAGEKFEIFSAGTQPEEVNRIAVDAMAEVGIDIAHNRSTPLYYFEEQPFDYAVIFCSPSSEICPSVPYAQQSFVWNISDPVKAGGMDADKLQRLREFRDMLSQKLQQVIVSLA
jgi:arsenate reductase